MPLAPHLILFRRDRSNVRERNLYKDPHTELEALIDEAEEEAEAIRNVLKAHMEEQGTQELRAGAYKARYTTVTSNRFDSAAFKKTHADLYAQYTKTTVTRRFTLA